MNIIRSAVLNAPSVFMMFLVVEYREAPYKNYTIRKSEA